jgi:O-antigen ligase
MNELFSTILWTIIGLVIIILILAKPYMGLIITIVSLPIVDLLPPIPILTSGIILVGLVTLASTLSHSKNKLFQNFDLSHIFGLLFSLWLLVSNFQASFLGESRNWFLTFIQLWVLMLLSSNILDTPKKQKTFMWIFAIVGLVTGIISISQGNIGDTISASTRAAGLSGNPNSNGRYLVVAMTFFYYLRSSSKNWLLKTVAMFGILVTFVAVFFTLSRTSILLLIAAVILTVLFKLRKNFSVYSITIFLLAFIILISFYEQIIGILNSIIPSITLGTDTVGVRYKLWQAGLRMWQENPIFGVGIGKFTNYLPIYGYDLNPHYWFSQLHNAYISALVETGLIGFILYFALIILTFRNFWMSKFENNVELTTLRNVWFVVFLIVALGEITANGLYDKLFWFLFGISVFIHNHSYYLQSKSSKNQANFHIPKKIIE